MSQAQYSRSQAQVPNVSRSQRQFQSAVKSQVQIPVVTKSQAQFVNGQPRSIQPMVSSYPIYEDFGKSTKDFFTKGFQTGSFKLSIRDQMSRYINATMTGTHDLEKKEASGDFQATLTCPFFEGYKSLTKWTTGNVITQELHSNDSIAKGLDIGLIGTYDLEKNGFNWKSQNAFRHDIGTVQAVIESPEEGEGNKPLVGGAVVTGYQDFAIGYQAQFDTGEQTLKKNNVAASFVRGPIKIYSSLENAELAWAGIVYQIIPALEVGLTATYKSDPEGYTVFGGAMKYVMDCCTAIKLKFDSDKMLGVGFEAKIRPTATITMSAEIDGNKLDEGGHKVGLCFDLEA